MIKNVVPQKFPAMWYLNSIGYINPLHTISSPILLTIIIHNGYYGFIKIVNIDTSG